MLEEDDESKRENGKEHQPDDESQQESHRKNSGPMEKPRLNDSPGAIL